MAFPVVMASMLTGRTGRGPWKMISVVSRKGDHIPSGETTNLKIALAFRVVSLSLFFSGDCLGGV